MDENLASDYIRRNFEPHDRLAVVLLQKKSGTVIQRIAKAEKISAPDFQAWLRHKNAQQFEVYISMNALHDGAKTRTKNDVAVIRHVYLDFDENGTVAVQRLLDRQDLPQPNYLLNTSPDKWQAVWKAVGFTLEQAEQLQRALAAHTGADPAATDCSRVLRVPGFCNYKYGRPYFIGVQSLSTEINGRERFPVYPVERGNHVAIDRSYQPAGTGPKNMSQSERDWAYAKRALARGELQEPIILAIANFRRYEKFNPQYYAEHTVKKAAQSPDAEKGTSAQLSQGGPDLPGR